MINIVTANFSHFHPIVNMTVIQSLKVIRDGSYEKLQFKKQRPLWNNSERKINCGLSALCDINIQESSGTKFPDQKHRQHYLNRIPETIIPLFPVQPSRKRQRRSVHLIKKDQPVEIENKLVPKTNFTLTSSVTINQTSLTQGPILRQGPFRRRHTTWGVPIPYLRFKITTSTFPPFPEEYTTTEEAEIPEVEKCGHFAVCYQHRWSEDNEPPNQRARETTEKETETDGVDSFYVKRQ